MQFTRVDPNYLALGSLCEKYEGLKYLGEFVNSQTHEVVPGIVYEYEGKYYSNPNDNCGISRKTTSDGKIKTILEVFEMKDFDLDIYKPSRLFPIKITEWGKLGDFSIPISHYAYALENPQIKEAQGRVKSIKNEVTISMQGVSITRENFLLSNFSPAVISILTREAKNPGRER